MAVPNDLTSLRNDTAGRQSILLSLRRVLLAADLSLWLAGATLALWDLIHNRGNVAAAAPPGALALNVVSNLAVTCVQL